MTKKSYRKKRVMRGVINKNVTLGALAAGDIVSADTETTTEKAFALSVEATYSLEDHTAGEGPIDVYVAHSDYSDAEVSEYIEAADGWDQGDMVEREKSRRKVRLVGTFPGLNTNETLNDGKPLKTKLKFSLNTGQGLSFYCYNRASAQLTAGTLMRISGHCWLVPA